MTPAGLELPDLGAAGARVAFVLDSGRCTYGEFAIRCCGARDELLREGAALLTHRSHMTVASFARFVAAACEGIPLVLLPPDADSDRVEFVARELRPLTPGSVVFLTSGTSGSPKAVGHTWASLARPVRVRPELRGSRWLLAYPYHLYAGLQVLLHALLNAGTIVTVPRDADPEGIVERMVDARVEYISATPSFVRRLLFAPRDRLSRAPLRQITLGGEPVPQEILDRLHALFPAARIAHIYATSELGRCFSVDDGREGFPASLLEAGTQDGTRLRIRDGELQVRSRHGMDRYLTGETRANTADGWWSTGDLVDRVGERVLFRGRSGDLIHVGGFKVSPQRIEDVLRTCAGVRDVRVFGVRSSLAGQLVAAEIVADGSSGEAELRTRLLEACTAKLTEPERPRLVRLVPSIELSAARKVVRHEEGNG